MPGPGTGWWSPAQRGRIPKRYKLIQTQNYAPWAFLSQTCDCGEPSLLHQRGKGWDVSRHRFLLKYLKMIFTCREISWRAFFVRLVALHDVIMILGDWASIVYTIVLLIFPATRLLVVYGLIGAWAIQLWVFFLFNVVVLYRRGCPVPSEALTLYPVFYKLPSILVLRLHAMLYNLLYYTPCVRNKNPAKRRLRKGDTGLMYLVADMASTWPLVRPDALPPVPSPAVPAPSRLSRLLGPARPPSLAVGPAPPRGGTSAASSLAPSTSGPTHRGSRARRPSNPLAPSGSTDVGLAPSGSQHLRSRDHLDNGAGTDASASGTLSPAASVVAGAPVPRRYRPLPQPVRSRAIVESRSPPPPTPSAPPAPPGDIV